MFVFSSLFIICLLLNWNCTVMQYTIRKCDGAISVYTIQDYLGVIWQYTHMHKILKFSLISWCGNFLETQQKLVHFHKISIPGNWVKLRHFMQWIFAGINISTLSTILFCFATISEKNMSFKFTWYHIYSFQQDFRQYSILWYFLYPK